MVRLRNRSQDTAADTAPEVYPQDTDVADHALHLPDETCARCNKPIKPTEKLPHLQIQGPNSRELLDVHPADQADLCGSAYGDRRLCSPLLLTQRVHLCC